MYSQALDNDGDGWQHTEVAPSIIVKRWETDVVFEGNPQIGLLLEVHPAFRPSFEAEIKTVVNRARLALLMPSAVLLVSFALDDPARIAIAALPDPNSKPEPPDSAL